MTSTTPAKQALVMPGPEMGSALIVLAEAAQCGCGLNVMLIVNRDGRTRCVVCDAKYTEARGPIED